jgi:hypothetical protein
LNWRDCLFKGHHRIRSLFFEKLRMGADSCQAQLIINDLVDQNAIIGDVAVLVAGVVADQWVIAVFCRKWFA